jgi:DNA (cytosine-5)-methyltransferase 1
MGLTFGSLFSGIGGIDLGFERAGMKCLWQSEIDPFAVSILNKRFPNARQLGDIRSIDWGQVEIPDIVCGGYPCQPFSYAGFRKGEQDERNLWPLMLRCISALQPQYVVLENVAGHLTLGFGTVLGDLAQVGYDAEWDCVPASAVGAPHRRDRLFVLAYPAGGERDGSKFQSLDTSNRGAKSGERRCFQKPERRRWETEPDIRRVADGIPHQLDRLRVLGNSVVPHVAEHIGRLLIQISENEV